MGIEGRKSVGHIRSDTVQEVKDDFAVSEFNSSKSLSPFVEIQQAFLFFWSSIFDIDSIYALCGFRLVM